MYKLNFIQYGRITAAICVVIFHLSIMERKYTDFNILNRLEFEYAFLIFFLISGFVVTYHFLTSNNFNHFQFLLNRLIRVYPTYWQFNLLLLPIFILYPHIINSSYQSPDLIASFLMIPQPEMNQAPLVMVGWTMVYELFFYFIFIFGLLIFKSNIILFCLVWEILLTFPYDGNNSWILTFLNPMNYLFVNGILCAYVFVKFKSKWDLPYNKILLSLANSTYSIYLSHIIVLSVLMKCWQFLGIQNFYLHCIFILFCVFSALFAGWLNYIIIERNLIKMGKKLISKFF